MKCKHSFNQHQQHMVLFQSQNSSSKSDNRTGEIKHVSKTCYFCWWESVRKHGVVDEGKMVKRNIKERRREGDWRGVLFETSHISLWILTHSSLFLLLLGSEAEETHGFTPAHRLQFTGIKGLNYLCPSLALLPFLGDLAHAASPRSCSDGELGGSGGTQGFPPLQSTQDWLSLTTPFLLLVLYIAQESKSLGAFKMPFKYPLKESLVKIWSRIAICSNGQDSWQIPIQFR